MAGEKFPLPMGPAGEWQGMATAEPQGRLRARNPAPGRLKNAAAKATNAASLMPRSKINAIMPRVISRGYGNFADGEICDRKRCYGPLCPEAVILHRIQGIQKSGGYSSVTPPLPKAAAP
jgi:hypothetical protein